MKWGEASPHTFPLPMKHTREARIYAEAAGMATAFGISVTTCDMLTTPVSRGYIHNVRDPHELGCTLTEAFTTPMMEKWSGLMDVAERMALDRGHDTCAYGVAITRVGHIVSMSIVRHYYSLNECSAGAIDEGEDKVFDLRDYDNHISVQ